MSEHDVPMWDETPEERAYLIALRRKDAERTMNAAYEATLAAARMTERTVLIAREAGMSWAEVGHALRMSRQAAHQRFRHVDHWLEQERKGTSAGQ